MRLKSAFLNSNKDIGQVIGLNYLSFSALKGKWRFIFGKIKVLASRWCDEFVRYHFPTVAVQC